MNYFTSKRFFGRFLPQLIYFFILNRSVRVLNNQTDQINQSLILYYWSEPSCDFSFFSIDNLILPYNKSSFLLSLHSIFVRTWYADGWIAMFITRSKFFYCPAFETKRYSRKDCCKKKRYPTQQSISLSRLSHTHAHIFLPFCLEHCIKGW